MNETKTNSINSYNVEQEEGSILAANPQLPTNTHRDQSLQECSNNFDKPNQLNFAIKAFLISIFTVGLLFVVYFHPFFGSIPSYQQEHHAQALFQVVNSGNKILTMNYSKPDFLRSRPLPELELGKIQQFLPEKIRQFIQILGTEFQIGFQLHNNWFLNKQIMFQAEYLILDEKFNLRNQVQQKHICILVPMKNPTKNTEIFFQSINQQNYSNYQVFLLQDSQIQNKQTDIFLASVKKYPRLNNRLWIARSSQKIGVLGLHDYVVRSFCSAGDIIMEMSMESSFVGKQVLNTFNRMYNLNKDAWFYYTDYLKFEGNHGQHSYISNTVSPGVDRKQNQLIQRQSGHRTSQVWLMGGLRSYLRDLYVKIPTTHLLQRGYCKYYEQVYETFVNYAIAQLAGVSHTFFYSGYSYLLHQNPQLATDGPDCLRQTRSREQAQSKIQTPFHPLPSLSQKPKIIKNYKIPEKLMREYVQKEWQQKICISKWKKIRTVFQSV